MRFLLHTENQKSMLLTKKTRNRKKNMNVPDKRKKNKEARFSPPENHRNVLIGPSSSDEIKYMLKKTRRNR